MRRCKLMYRFGSAIQEFLATPFGYFVALAPGEGSDFRTIMMSHDLNEWKLVHRFHYPGNYVLYRGWDYCYDGKKGKGLLLINEKNNSFGSTCYCLNGVIFSSSEYCTAYREPNERGRCQERIAFQGL